ncbi:MAG TPA: N-acetylmuramic acid 6-phosphate etherase [Verrucomicrobiae bacterium]|jgi:N-acetylmuramic acid 6-phosphate etherase
MKAPTPPSPLLLGIEGGGTRTVALLADASGKLLQRVETGPANLRLLTDAQLVRHLRAIARSLPKPSALAIGLAGARGEKEWQRIRSAAGKVWPGVSCHATNDLETALAADSAFHIPHSALPQVLVVSGTGSCCYGRTPDGRALQFGGWGHLLGDKGSGFEIGLRALKAVVYYLDRDGGWSRLGQQILRALSLNEPNDLIPWAQSANKADIAALAVEVFKAGTKRDAIARDILEGAAHSLAKDAVSCAARLCGKLKAQSSKLKAERPVQFVFAGSVLLKQPAFARKVGKLIVARWPGAIIAPLNRESAWGAVALARESSKFKGQSSNAPTPIIPHSAFRIPHSRELSPTERRHPLSMNLDRLPLAEAIALMLREDEKVPVAVLGERKHIKRAVQLVTRAFKRGGRLSYVGAGTSGRLGILDASECPPTFRADPEMVQGIIAGGQRAITMAVEGAEDDADAGARAIQFRGVTKRDVVVGIAASGRTPFVWGALNAAKKLGAPTVLISFNPHLEIPRALRPAVVITPDLGPEILTGSTRLKSGTATKLILNILTTLAMVRLGKVLGNLMVDLNPSNVKLRDRAVRIVRELTGADYDRAKAALEKSGWVVKKAVLRLGRR